MKDYLDKSDEQIIELLKKDNRPVVIYGALFSNQAIVEACRKMGIEIVKFCDDSSRKANRKWCEVEVLSFNDIIEKYGKVIFILNISYIKPIVEKIEKAGSEWISCSTVVNSEAFKNLKDMEEIEYYKSEVKRACYCHANYLTPGKLYISNVDIVITERCSLRCKDCSNLMQFYEKPIDYDSQKVIENTKSLLNIADGIYELRFIGGEPFMNRNIHKIMEAFIDDLRVEKLLIYTNATILPTEEQWKVFENHKVVFMMTNYGGDLSANYDKMLEQLKQRDIIYHTLRMDAWNPCASFEYNERNETEKLQVFDCCSVKNYVTLINEKLYRCPFAAHAMNLKAVPECVDDYFDVSCRQDIKTAREQLRDYLFNKKYLATCDYCVSRAYDAQQIPAAIQCSAPLHYTKY